MRKIYTIIFILLTTICYKANASSKIIAVVGNKIITSHDVDERLILLKKINNNEIPDNIEIRKEVIKNLVDEKLYAIEAERFGIKVSDEELKQKLYDIHKSQPLINIKSPTVVNQVKVGILWAKIVNGVLRQKISVSQDEVDEGIKLITKNTKISLKQIFIPESYFLENKNKINKEKAQIKSCKDVDYFAQKNNLAKPEKVHTDLHSMQDQVRLLVAKLPVGVASDYINLMDNVQILVVCSKVAADITEEDKENFKNNLIEKKLEIAAKKYLGDIRKKTFIEYIN